MKASFWRATRAIPAFASFIIGAVVSSTQPVAADEGGVSFWLPGLYGSLAAAPGQPGWSFATFNYFTSVGAGANADFERGGGVVAGLNSHVDFQYLAPSYTFAEPVLGGVASVGAAALFGHNNSSVSATLAGPAGRTISGSRNDFATGFGDLYPNAAIRWNQGVNNFMTYLTGDIPVGLYAQQLANLGIGHGAVDGGGGYTYFDTQKGHEFSAVLGLTYNFINTLTNYQNGVDSHLDWALSQFLTPQFQVGAVGYVYQQLTGDSGSGDRVGAFKSSAVAVGPQIGYLFPVDGMQGYLNLKGYDEVCTNNRASGWNVWLTLSIAPAAPAAKAPQVVAKY